MVQASTIDMPAEITSAQKARRKALGIATEVFFYLVMTALAVIFLAPLAWMITASLRPENKVLEMPPAFIPTDFQYRFDKPFFHVFHGKVGACTSWRVWSDELTRVTVVCRAGCLASASKRTRTRNGSTEKSASRTRPVRRPLHSKHPR